MRSAEIVFCSAGELRFFEALRVRGQIVGFDTMCSSMLSSCFLISALGVGDFVLDGVIFLVGLHRHRLVAVFREASLVDGDLFFNRAAGLLVLGEPGLGLGDALSCRLEALVEDPLALGAFRQFLPRRAGLAVEALQRDDPFQIHVHRCQHSTRTATTATREPMGEVR